MGFIDVQGYDSQHVYIVDAPDPSTVRRRVLGEQAQLSQHEHNCVLIKKLFEKHGDSKTQIHEMCFPKRSTEAQYLDYWRQELDTKTKRDLIIIYYHGSASGEDEDYCWKFTGFPRRDVSAWTLLKLLSETETDCLLLCDCFIHTRLTDKAEDFEREIGSTEIIAAPQGMQDTSGKRVEHDGDFTTALVVNLDLFITGIEDDYKGWKALTSIPKLMARDEGMYSNPLRIWFSKSAAGSKRQVRRIIIDPTHIRRTRKLSFFSGLLPPIEKKQKRGTVREDGEANGVEEGEADGEDELPEDEGFDEMESVAGPEGRDKGEDPHRSSSSGAGLGDEIF